MKISPVGDVIMVKETEVLDKTPGGLYIPDSVQSGSMAVNVAVFEVVDVGTGFRNKDTGVEVPLPAFLKPGIKVLMARESLSEYKVGVEKGFFTKSGAVIAVVQDD